MIDWILSWFRKPEPVIEKQIDPSTPCWRCSRVLIDGPRSSHNCPHGYHCVMLGWTCLRCRALYGMLVNRVCPTVGLKCQGGDCEHLKEVEQRIAEGKEPWDGFEKMGQKDGG